MIKEKTSENKPKVGIFGLTCCEGCQIEILDLEDVLLDVIDKLDILSFRLAKAEDINHNFDLVFLEGSISTVEDLEKTKKIREKTKILVALGSCACTGGVQAQKNFLNKKSIETSVYGNSKLEIIPVDPKALSEEVKIDYYIRGCPIDKLEFVEILKKLLLEVNPRQREWSVCVECKINENPCLLDEGKICLGPVTYCGCNSVCTNNSQVCIGCRGIMEDANIKEFVQMLKDKKHKILDIKEAFQTIFGNHPKLKEVK